MAINALKAHILGELKAAREESQPVKSEDLRYPTFESWIAKWHGTTLIPSQPGAGRGALEHLSAVAQWEQQVPPGNTARITFTRKFKENSIIE
jgi:hypothetical protein